MSYLWIIMIFLCFCFIYYLFIYLLYKKISQLEYKIENQFQLKNNLIPLLYEVTQPYIHKHDLVFHDIMVLRKLNFSEHNFYENIHKSIYTQQKIHKEMDFIFRVSQKHPQLIKNYKFYYTKELIFQRVDKLWEYMELYKNMTKKFNRLSKIRYFTIIWFIFKIGKKEEI